MEPLDYLRRFGPRTAIELADNARMSHEEIYAHLAALESAGKVRVQVRYPTLPDRRSAQPKKYWEAM
jgi:DNA-binding transcriptional ArsR family regulator